MFKWFTRVFTSSNSDLYYAGWDFADRELNKAKRDGDDAYEVTFNCLDFISRQSLPQNDYDKGVQDRLNTVNTNEGAQ